MKPRVAISLLAAILVLPSCDEDDNNNDSALTGGSGGGGAGDGSQQGGEPRSFVGKRVRFVGTSDSTSTTTVAGATFTTTTNTSTDVTDQFFADGTVVSNGSATINSINSSAGAVPGAGTTTQIVNDSSIYTFTLASDGNTATLVSFDDDNSQFTAELVYSSDTTGTYTQNSDQVINGVRLVTSETGTFEILD